MPKVFNAGRLTLARKRRGLTKVAFAEEVGISPRIVTDYERGEKVPSPRTLARIAEVVRFPIGFFYGADLDEPSILASSFRSLSTLTATQRDQGRAAAALALAFSKWIDDRFRLPEPNLPQYQGIDPETAAMAVRSEWNLGERPILNMIHLLEGHGVRVFSLAEECAELDAFSFWHASIPYVFLNTVKSAERSRMDAAHELGHLVLHWKIGVRGRETEREAEQFASAFLMPKGSILAEAPRRGTLTEIIRAKKRWNVSAASLTYRMHRLGLLTDWQYRSLFVEIARNGYRTEEPDGSHHEKSQLLAKVFQTLRDEGITEAGIARDLEIEPSELKKLIFGLFRPALRLV